MKKLAILLILVSFSVVHASDDESGWLFNLTSGTELGESEDEHDQALVHSDSKIEDLLVVFKEPCIEGLSYTPWDVYPAADLKLLPEALAQSGISLIVEKPPKMPEEVKEAPQKVSDILTWQALKSSLVPMDDKSKGHVPYCLHFQSGPMHYRLSDTDGLATILTIYCVYAGEVHQQMADLEPGENPVKLWVKYASLALKGAGKAVQMLRHCLDRYKDFHGQNNTQKVQALEAAISKLSEAQGRKGGKGSIQIKPRKKIQVKDGITLQLLYQTLKPWFTSHYENMEPYNIEVTDRRNGEVRLVKGLIHQATGNTKWVALGNTLSYLSHLDKFEKSKPRETGVCWFQSDLVTVLDANNLQRSMNQGLFSDYREVMSTTRRSDGSVVITTEYIPLRPEPRIAIGHAAYGNGKVKVETIETTKGLNVSRPKQTPTSFKDAVQLTNSKKQKKDTSAAQNKNDWKSVKKK